MKLFNFLILFLLLLAGCKQKSVNTEPTGKLIFLEYGRNQQIIRLRNIQRTYRSREEYLDKLSEELLYNKTQYEDTKKGVYLNNAMELLEEAKALSRIQDKTELEIEKLTKAIKSPEDRNM